MATMNQSESGVKGSAAGTPKGTKMMSLGDLLTDAEIKSALKCKTADEIAAKVIRPALERINIVTGQENDAMYLAYAIRYALTGGVR